MVGVARASALALAACGRVGFAPVGDVNGDAANGDGSSAAEANIMFVTSTLQVPGALGGIGGADAVCGARATEAGLPGTYLAWLATSTASAESRLLGSRGWQRTDGRPFADTVDDLVAGKIFYPPRLDEHGNDLLASGSPSVATGDATSNCADWTSAANIAVPAGLLLAGGVYWRQGALVGGCPSDARLYCFGIGKQASVTLAPPASRRAFVSTPWMPSGGVVAADAHCQANADVSGLGGQFAALLATTMMPATARFDLTSTPWMRLDGVLVSATAQALATGDTVAPLNVQADRTVAMSIRTYSGSTSPDAVGQNETCMDWTSPTGGSARVGRTHESGPAFFGPTIFVNGCSDASIALTCLER